MSQPPSRGPASAADWLEAGCGTAVPDLVVVGAPISRASISPSRAWETPTALRQALRRFPLWDADHDVDLTGLRVRDHGDVVGDRDDEDCRAAHARIEDAVGRAAAAGSVVAILGGDNSLTLPALLGLAGRRLDEGVGLLTLDAHHDVRERPDGLPRNGTPVRDLIEAGLPGERVAQVGIAAFGNARIHAEWAASRGIHVRRISDVREAGITAVLAGVLQALDGAGVRRLLVDIDVDVLDRAHAPACPASLPGGMLPGELQAAAFLLGRDSRVVGIDLTEVDAAADVNGVTVRAAASVLLAFCSGLTQRLHTLRVVP